MTFDLTQLGRWTEEVEYKVTSEAISAYAAATNDDDPRHASGELAPPLFATVVALIDVTSTAVSQVWPDDTGSGFDIRRVHGEEDVIIHRAVVPGMVLRSRAACVGIHPKSSGCILVSRVETRDQTGELVCEGTHVTFVRGLIVDGEVGELPPSKAVPCDSDTNQPAAEVRHWVDSDQSFRYAEASRDYGPYHVSEGAARDAGFAGVIVHGLCSMAFASRAIAQTACPNDSTRLKRLAVRFMRPLPPNQEVTTRIYSAGTRGNRNLYTFEVEAASGDIVIGQGLAEVLQ